MDLPRIAENLDEVCQRIAEAAKKAGRSADEITLIAVTKQVEPERIEEAIQHGVQHIGENRVQEAQAKFPKLRTSCTKHLIGTLQSNKAGRALQLFDLIHSVDRLSLIEALSRRAGQAGCDVLLQVNVSGEATKGGVAPGQLEALARAASEASNIRVRGLMTIPPYSPDPEDARPHFAKLRELGERLARLELPRVQVEILSMGMSNDFAVAIEEGATHVRIGTAIFGERRYP